MIPDKERPIPERPAPERPISERPIPDGPIPDRERPGDEVIGFLATAAGRHVELLRGEVEPLELFFPAGGWGTALDFYQFNPMASYHNGILREVVAALAAELTGPLRVLEVGAGTGGTTAELLEVLPPERTTYLYTDVSQFFLSGARQRFAANPYLRYGLLDADKDPGPQGYAPGSIDMIIAANVLHDLRDAAASLTNLRSLLVPGGFLLALETTRNSALQKATVGFVSSPRIFIDGRAETGEPLFTRDEWVGLAEAAGFARVAVQPPSGSAEEAYEQHVLIAQAPLSATGFDEEEIRSHLAERLPGYMVPASLHPIAKVPLTANGKVDRAALAGHSPQSAPAAASAGRSPRTPTERRIAELWAKTLQISSVGADESFLSLGGDSLMAAQLVAQLNKELGASITLRQFLDLSNVERVAAFLESSGAPNAPNAPDAAPAERPDRIPLSAAQRRLWFVEQWHAGRASPYVEVRAIRVTGALDLIRFQESLTRVVARHEALRTTFHEEDGVPWQRIEDTVPVPVEQVDLSDVPAADRAARIGSLMTTLSRHRFDLARGPLLRVVAPRLSGDECVLIVVLHHLLGDGWSLSIFNAEIAAGYLVADEQPPPRLQYADYALAEQAWLTGPEAERQRTFWRDRLDGVEPSELGRGNRTADDIDGDAFQGTIPADTLAAVKTIARERDTTLFMLLCAAFRVVLRQETRRSMTVLTTDVAGRSEPELQNLIGLFVNQVILPLDVPDGIPFTALLTRERDAALDAFAHQDLPYDEVIRLSPVGRDIFSEVKLVLQNVPTETAVVAGLTFEPLPVPADTAKFDFLLDVTESRGALDCVIRYRKARFTAAQVRSLWARFDVVLGAVATDPALSVDDLVRRAEEIGEAHQRQARDGFQRAGAELLRRRRSGQRAGERRDERTSEQTDERTDAVSTGFIEAVGWRLATITAARGSTDLLSWATGHRDQIVELMHRHGGVLLRDFQVPSESFGAVVELIGGTPLEPYVYRSTPRTHLGGNVYTSTEYPADQTIAFHNENAYTDTWPGVLAFSCVRPGAGGGETPLARSDRVLARLPDELVAAFTRLGVTYLRRFGVLDLSWQTAFQTEDRDQVEEICRARGIDFTWSGDGLRTSQSRPAIIEHPTLGLSLWFNQALLFHHSSLPAAMRHALLDLDEGPPPRDVLFGDGSPIPDSAIADVRAAYEAESLVFRWRSGDVLILDNMLLAHGRRPYTGDRLIMTAMCMGLP